MWPSAAVLLLVAIGVEGGAEGDRDRVLAGCAAALGAAECVLDDDPNAASEPLSASVTIDAEFVSVSVRSGSSEPVVRELELSPSDGSEQRAMAAGLLVAALAADLERSAAARALAAEEERPPPSQQEPLVAPLPAVPVPAPERSRKWMLDVGALATMPAEGLALHLGGQAQVGYFLSSRFVLFLSARGDTALPGGLDASRLGLGFGPGVELLPQARRISLLITLDARLEELRLAGGLSEPQEASVLRGGAALGARLGFPSRRAGLYAGLEAALMGPEVDVYVGGEAAGKVPLWSLSLLLGGRLASFRSD